MNPETTPQFTLADAEDMAARLFGVAASATPLPSERDQNFTIEATSGARFVLKIANAHEDRSTLEFQNAAMKHVAQRASGLELPCPVLSSAGEDIATIHDVRARSHFVRLVSWLDGVLWVNAGPHDETLLISLGTALAEFDLALRDFQHPAMKRKLHWDVRHADLALEHLPLLSADRRTIVRRFMAAWAVIDWQRLRHCVIHGDANDYNVIVRDGRVSGLLDFGDMVHSALVCDLAVALAYAMLDQPRPLAVAATIIGAYNRRLPLTTAEQDAIFALATARLCMSVCYAAYNERAKSDDAYQQVTAAPAWALLERLGEISPQTANAAIHAACRPV